MMPIYARQIKLFNIRSRDVARLKFFYFLFYMTSRLYKDVPATHECISACNCFYRPGDVDVGEEWGYRDMMRLVDIQQPSPFLKDDSLLIKIVVSLFGRAYSKLNIMSTFLGFQL